MNLTEQIPGLREAIAQEQLVRDASFLELREQVCGFDVDPLTLRHVLTLESIASPLLCGGQSYPHDFAAFLMLVKPCKGFERWNLLRKFGRIKYQEAFDSISNFICEATQDAIGGSIIGEQISYYSFGASIVDCLSREYGWSESSILDMPVKRIFQYMKIIARRGGETILFNPSDKVRGQWLAKINKRN